MNRRALCRFAPLALCSLALADPVVPGASVTLVGVLPAGYRPYTLDIFTEVGGPYEDRWLYFGSDNNSPTGQVLVRMRTVTDPGTLHAYCTAVYDPDGVLVDQTGALTGAVGRVLLGCSNPSDGNGLILRTDPSSNEAGDGFANPHSYAEPAVNISNCDSMTQDAAERLYLNVPTLNQVARMVGHPVNNGATFETFAQFPVACGTLVYEQGAGSGRLWSSGTDGVIRRIDIDDPAPLPRNTSQMLSVNLATGTENGLCWSRASAASGGGPWGGGALAVRRGSGNGQLVRIRSDSGAVDTLGSGMGDVYGMKVDQDGVLYAADYSTGQVWRIDRITRLGCGPADAGGAGGSPLSDGRLSNDDFIVFIDWFFQHDLRADRGATGGIPGADGAWDNNDFVVFIDQFFEGC